MAKRKTAKNKPVEYRRHNYLLDMDREQYTIHFYPVILDGLRDIAKMERKNINWVVEYIVSDYLGIRLLLKQLKGNPKPAYQARDGIVKTSHSIHLVRRKA